jgi:predicted transcriptional regulator
VKNILCGIKRYELRRRIPINVKRIVIYATSPESRIAAIADIEEVFSDTPEMLWDKVCGAASITHEFYKNYFDGAKEAFAMHIGRIRMLERKISLNHPQLRLTPPQSFCYLDEKKMSWLLSCTVQ